MAGVDAAVADVGCLSPAALKEAPPELLMTTFGEPALPTVSVWVVEPLSALAVVDVPAAGVVDVVGPDVALASAAPAVALESAVPSELPTPLWASDGEASAAALSAWVGVA